MIRKLKVYYNDLKKLKLKKKRKNRFGATKSQIDSFLVRAKGHRLNKSLIGDALDTEVANTLKFLSNEKNEYLKLLNTQSGTETVNGILIPDYAKYNINTKFEIDNLAKQVIDFYGNHIKQQFELLMSELISQTEFGVFKGNDMYIYKHIDQSNYEVNRNEVIRKVVAKIKEYSGNEYIIKTYYKDTIKGISTSQSGITVIWNGWTIFTVYVYPIENLMVHEFKNSFVVNNQFNENGKFYTLIAQQLELPHFLYEYDTEEMGKPNLNTLLPALKSSLKNGGQFCIECINKFFPDIFTQRDKQIVEKFYIYIFYFVNYIKDFVVTGGNSINIKLNNPVVNDLDFIYTGNMTKENFKKNLVGFAFFLHDKVKLQTIQQKVEKKQITFKFDNVVIRETQNKTRNSTQYSIDLVFMESMDNSSLENKYTLAEFAFYDTITTVESVPLTIHFNDIISEHVRIQSVAKDLSVFSKLDIVPRTKAKIERDLLRLTQLISRIRTGSFNGVVSFDDKGAKPGVFKCVDFHGQNAEWTYLSFEKYIHELFTYSGNHPRSEIIFASGNVYISKISVPDFNPLKGKLGTILVKYQKGGAKQQTKKSLEDEFSGLEVTQRDISIAMEKIVAKMKKVPGLIPKENSNEKVYKEFIDTHCIHRVNNFVIELLSPEKFSQDFFYFRKLKLQTYFSKDDKFKEKTKQEIIVYLTVHDKQLLADLFRNTFLPALFKNPGRCNEFIKEINTIHLPILDLNEEVRLLLEDIIILCLFRIYALQKHIDDFEDYIKVANSNLDSFYIELMKTLQHHLSPADLQFLSKYVYK